MKNYKLAFFEELFVSLADLFTDSVMYWLSPEYILVMMCGDAHIDAIIGMQYNDLFRRVMLHASTKPSFSVKHVIIVIHCMAFSWIITCSGNLIQKPTISHFKGPWNLFFSFFKLSENVS